MTDVALIDGVVRPLGPWRRIVRYFTQWNAQTAVAQAAMRSGAANTSGTGSSALGALYLDPDDTPRIRLRQILVGNATNPAATFSLRLKPLGTPDGAATTTQSDETQTVVSDSTVSKEVSSAGAAFVDEIELACPASGLYVIEAIISANMAASSVIGQIAELDGRGVR